MHTYRRPYLRLLALVAVVGAAGVLVGGCHWYVQSVGVSHRTHGHVHASGCGHYYYHDAWYDYPHSHDCHHCSPRVIVTHVHGGGCGHYYWHNTWWEYPHPHDCFDCRPRVVRVVHHHGPSCGHYYWHNAWYDYPHAHDCHCHGGASVRIRVSGRRR